MATILLPACSQCRQILEEGQDCPTCSKAITIEQMHKIASDNNVLAGLLYGTYYQAKAFDKAAESSREWFNSYPVQVVIMRYAPIWAPILFLLFALFLRAIMHTG